MDRKKISRVEAAKILGVTPNTIRNWVDQGRFKDVERDDKGRLLLNKEEVLAMWGEDQSEHQGKADPVAIFDRVRRRVPNGLEFVTSLVDLGCDQRGVVTCCDEIFRQVARDKWEAMVRGWEIAFANAFGEFLDDWSYRGIADKAHRARYEELFKELVELVKVAEFGPEAANVRPGSGEAIFAGYPVPA